jgi:HAD superfamily hydrolase (TIGR01490 family)
VNEVKKCGGRITAFFDLDGTLAAEPSLEQRFFRMLRCRREIPAKNYFLWAREAVRLARRGVRALRFENKMYLRGVPIGEVERQYNGILFFPGAIERVAWHARRSHKIVIVSGTLEMLARQAAKRLERELEARGLAAEIYVRATRLEERAGRWTGRLMGVAMCGEAKVEVMRKMAEKEELDLARCYAYGDSAMDRWMIEAVGRPAAVNPSKELLRIARRKNWKVMSWEERGKEELTESAQRAGGRSGEKQVAKLEMRA